MVLLAKGDGETLLAHTRECLKLAEKLFDSLPGCHPYANSASLWQDLLLAVAAHDIGKAAIGFQNVLKLAMRGSKANWGGRRHEVISAAFLSYMTGVAPSVVLAVLTHHRSLPGDIVTSDTKTLDRFQLPLSAPHTPVWDEMAKDWYDNRAEFTIFWQEICQHIGRPELATIYGLGLLALRPNWLERGYAPTGQRASVPYHERLYASLLRGLTIAADRLASAHYEPCMEISFRKYKVIWHQPRGFQTRAAQLHGSGILQAPTGSGKTDASLLWAQSNQCSNGRMFYTLPNIASINAMYERLAGNDERKGVFPRSSVGLLHSRAASALYDAEGDDEYGYRKLRQKQAYDLQKLARLVWFPIRVCTPHQLLRFSLRGKGWENMLLEFPGALFIVDEVHAYEPRIVGLLLATLKLACQWGAKFFIMSATMPSFLKDLVRQHLDMPELLDIQPDPANEGDREVLQRKRHRLTIDTASTSGTLLDHLTEIEESSKKVSHTLVVCNTVGAAQKIFGELKHINDKRLIHSRFTKADRRILERDLRCKLPRVLVATQVIEVSLNISFDRGFFEPAPIDALIQRMGRVNREGTAPEVADVFVFSEELSPGTVYRNRELVKKSKHELAKLNNPLGERDLVIASDRVYEKGYTGDDGVAFDEGVNHDSLKNFDKVLLAGAHEEWVRDVIERADTTFDILPRSKEMEYVKLMRHGLWLEADSLLVPVTIPVLKGVSLDTNHEPWVADCGYHPTLGLLLSGKIARNR